MAIMDGIEHYHQPTDNFENLNRNSAYHFLVITMRLTEYAANNSLERLQRQSGSAVFFPFFPGNLVVISFMWAYVLCVFSILLALAFFVIEYKKKCLRFSFTALSMSVLIIFSVLSAVIFHEASYLFWIPLFGMTITAFSRKWAVVYSALRAVSILAALLLWVPLVYLIPIAMGF